MTHHNRREYFRIELPGSETLKLIVAGDEFRVCEIAENSICVERISYPRATQIENARLQWLDGSETEISFRVGPRKYRKTVLMEVVGIPPQRIFELQQTLITKYPFAF